MKIKNQMKIIVRTFAGFEEILSEEIFQITNIKPEIGKRAVYLNGGLEIIYSLNLWCRLALDVLVEYLDIIIKQGMRMNFTMALMILYGKMNFLFMKHSRYPAQLTLHFLTILNMLH